MNFKLLANITRTSLEDEVIDVMNHVFGEEEDIESTSSDSEEQEDSSNEESTISDNEDSFSS